MPRKILFAILIFVAHIARGQVQPYAGGGVGLAPAGFAQPSYNADAGVDLNLHRWFTEAEVGVDSANDQQTRNGYKLRAHGLFLLHATHHWRFGGGVHYSQLTTSTYTKHDRWPIVAAMYENDWVRSTLEYLLPGGDARYGLTGPVVDLRVRISGGFYFRERVAAFAFKNSSGSDFAYHPGAEGDIGLIYVIHDSVPQN
jgi:hypothetical protein